MYNTYLVYALRVVTINISKSFSCTYDLLQGSAGSSSDAAEIQH